MPRTAHDTLDPSIVFVIDPQDEFDDGYTIPRTEWNRMQKESLRYEAQVARTEHREAARSLHARTRLNPGQGFPWYLLWLVPVIMECVRVWG